MTLNLQDSHVEKLVNEIASETGESPSQAMINALEERLARVQRGRAADNLFEDIMEISRRCRALADQDERSPHEILGYAKNGRVD